jgi:hypothetical protein
MNLTTWYSVSRLYRTRSSTVRIPLFYRLFCFLGFAGRCFRHTKLTRNFATLEGFTDTRAHKKMIVVLPCDADGVHTLIGAQRGGLDDGNGGWKFDRITRECVYESAKEECLAK